MAFLEWSSDLRVGIEQIDQEHESCIALLNVLHAAMMAGANNARLVEMFDGLMEAIEHGFAAEQNLFEAHCYLSAADHLALHEAFMKRTIELQWEFEIGKVPVSSEALEFLNAWLSNHFRGPDKACAEFFRKHGLH